MAKYNVARLQEFFLEMAMTTYASGEKPTRPSDRPWIKQFRRVGEGKFEGLIYLDEYSTNGENSGGTTWFLSADDISHPLWIMQYDGWCKNDNAAVLDVLKERLCLAYERCQFLGGRGVDGDVGMANQVLCYRNEWHGRFIRFGGQERIFVDKTPETVFWHRFQGMLLGEVE